MASNSDIRRDCMGNFPTEQESFHPPPIFLSNPSRTVPVPRLTEKEKKKTCFIGQTSRALLDQVGLLYHLKFYVDDKYSLNSTASLFRIKKLFPLIFPSILVYYFLPFKLRYTPHAVLATSACRKIRFNVTSI